MITKISTQQKNPDRVSVEIDGKFAFGLEATDLMKFGLKKGHQLTEDDASELIVVDEGARATDAAVLFLGYRPRSEREVRIRLRKRGYSPEAIDVAVQRTREWGYLDDQKFAEFWVDNRTTHKPRGKRLLRQELREKGVEQRIIDEILDDADIEEYDAALQLARKRNDSLTHLSHDLRYRRLSGYLARRGYGWDVVGPVLREVLVEEDPEEENL